MSFRAFVRRPLLWAGRLITDVVERLWHPFFWVVGCLRAPSLAHWSSSGGHQVMVIAPHPDDELIGCGGTIQRHLQAGDKVCVVYVTDGRRAGSLLTPDDLVQQRYQESSQVMAALGIDKWHWLGLREREWQAEALIVALTPLLTAFTPDMIYVPSLIDYHPDHVQIAEVLASMLPQFGVPLVRVYQIQVPLRWLANLIAPTPDMTNFLALYVSQQWLIARTLRMRRYNGYLYRLHGQGEVFWQMTALQYSNLHKAKSRYTFQGLRYFSGWDPLVYWHGRKARQALARKMQ